MNAEHGLTRNDASKSGTPWVGALGARYVEHQRCVDSDGRSVEVQLSRENEPSLRGWYNRDEMRAAGLREVEAT
jgi:hypothetical protein